MSDNKRPADYNPLMDDDDTAMPLKKKDRKNEFNFIVWHVKPHDPRLETFGIQVTGYGEALATGAYFARSPPKHKKFIETNQMYPLVFFRSDDGVPVKNKNGYDCKVLLFKKQATLTVENIEAWLYGRFIPKLEELGAFAHSKMPTYDRSEHYKVVDTYSEFLQQSSLIKYLEATQCRGSNGTSNKVPFEVWLKADPARLYSVFTMGKLSLETINAYGLNATHLHGSDLIRFNEDQETRRQFREAEQKAALERERRAIEAMDEEEAAQQEAASNSANNSGHVNDEQGNNDGNVIPPSQPEAGEGQE